MKKLVYLLFFICYQLTAQDVYKGRKFFGGYFYINSDALKDILIDGDNTDSFGEEYWNNSPFDKKQGKDVKIRGKMSFDLRYGYFPMDEFAIGGGVMNFSSLLFITSWASLFYIGAFLWRDLLNQKVC